MEARAKRLLSGAVTATARTTGRRTARAGQVALGALAVGALAACVRGSEGTGPAPSASSGASSGAAPGAPAVATSASSVASASPGSGPPQDAPAYTVHMSVTSGADGASADVHVLVPAERLTHGKRNPIAAWLDGLGLFGKRSYEKFVPQPVFALPTDQVVLFLRHLWATDGSVLWNQSIDGAQIYYASTSRRLVDDVMQLLLRLGVFSRIARVRSRIPRLLALVYR